MFKKWEWLIIYVPLILCWGLDRITKQLALGLEGMKSLGIFHLILHFNHGAMLGIFSDLPALLRIVSLSTGGAFLIFTYGIIQYLLPIKSVTLRAGMSILLGGILGNVSDRIIWGYVVDFLVIGTPTLSTAVFNLADAFQWVGYGMIIFALIKENQILWPENNSRKQYWINPHFQLKYCFILVGVGIGLSIIAGVFSYTYLRVTIIEITGPDTTLINKFLIPFVITFIIISITFLSSLFLIGKLISHKTAGPLYAFERFLEKIIKGEFEPLKLRAGDEFQHLEELANKIRIRLKYLHKQINKNDDLTQETKKNDPSAW